MASSSDDKSNATHERISALFLGPKAENADFLIECFKEIVHMQVRGRKAYFPNDAVSRRIHITDFILTTSMLPAFHYGRYQNFRSICEAERRCVQISSVPPLRPRKELDSILLSSVQRSHVCWSKPSSYPWLFVNDVLQSEQCCIRSEPYHYEAWNRCRERALRDDGIFRG